MEVVCAFDLGRLASAADEDDVLQRGELVADGGDLAAVERFGGDEYSTLAEVDALLEEPARRKFPKV